MKKKLDFNYPFITTYTQHAHLLGILSCNKKTLSWIYSNYIQIYINKNLRMNTWGDFYFPMPYEIRNIELCKWIETQKISEEFVCSNFGGIVDYICTNINNNYYVHIMVNFRYIKGSYAFIEGKNAYHDLLVIGYDNDTKMFTCADFKYSLNNSYEEFECSFNDMVLAFEDERTSSEKLYMNHQIYSYKLKDECDYEYDSQNILFGLKNYYFSIVPEYWNGYNYANKQYVTFGMNYYKVVTQYLLDEKPWHIQTSIVYLLLDYKKIMIDRLRFLLNDYPSLASCIDDYKRIYTDMQIIINLVIKYDVNHKEKLLYKIAERLMIVYEEERSILRNVILILQSSINMTDSK